MPLYVRITQLYAQLDYAEESEILSYETERFDLREAIAALWDQDAANNDPDGFDKLTNIRIDPRYGHLRLTMKDAPDDPVWCTVEVFPSKRAYEEHAKRWEEAAYSSGSDGSDPLFNLYSGAPIR